MPRATLDRHIHDIQDEVLLLGSMVEQASRHSVDALIARDITTAHSIYQGDHAINEKRYAIENAILILMATQQPMARDLRTLAAVLEVITELERIGDYAKGIAKVTIRLGDAPMLYSMRNFVEMSKLGIDMLHRALSAFFEADARAAHAIPDEDTKVDELYNETYRELIALMIAHPDNIDQANLLLWVAHNLERTADRATNICERTVFIVTGELMEMDAETDDEEESE